MLIMAKYSSMGTLLANRAKRITSFLNPWLEDRGAGWQIIQGLYAIASGGLFGVGLRKQHTKIFVHIGTA